MFKACSILIPPQMQLVKYQHDTYEAQRQLQLEINAREAREAQHLSECQTQKHEHEQIQVLISNDCIQSYLLQNETLQQQQDAYQNLQTELNLKLAQDASTQEQIKNLEAREATQKMLDDQQDLILARDAQRRRHSSLISAEPFSATMCRVLLPFPSTPLHTIRVMGTQVS